MVNGTNIVLKYGVPTDNLPLPIASMIKGYMVPNKTMPQTVLKTTLLNNSAVSRDTMWKLVIDVSRDARIE
jgi:hypothetical protein